MPDDNTKWEEDRKVIAETPAGPWTSNQSSVRTQSGWFGVNGGEAMARFIAAARARWPAALDEVERLKVVVDTLNTEWKSQVEFVRAGYTRLWEGVRLAQDCTFEMEDEQKKEKLESILRNLVNGKTWDGRDPFDQMTHTMRWRSLGYDVRWQDDERAYIVRTIETVDEIAERGGIVEALGWMAKRPTVEAVDFWITAHPHTKD
jgi:hypothetical protein